MRLPNDPADPATTGPPPGSIAWYAILFSPVEQRPALRALHELREALRQPARIGADPQPARLRLAWWGEELSLLAAGRPRHPATRRLARFLAQQGPDTLRLLEELRHAAEADLEGHGCATEDAWRLYAFRRWGASLAAAGILTGMPKDQAIDLGREAGLAVGGARLLATLGADLHHGSRLLLPLAWLDAEGLGEQSPATPEAIAPLLRRLVEQSEASAKAATRLARDAGARASFTAIVLSLSLDQARLAAGRLAREIPPQPVRSGSLRRLWSAWRTAIALSRDPK